jgi:dipeptidase E
MMRQIIAMGGGGFSMEEENPLLDEYILSQSNNTKPKVCFVPTASGDADGYIEQFYRCFAKFECESNHLSLFRGAPTNLAEFVSEQDIFYVGGGSTRNLLILWREWGLDNLIRSAYANGAILTGLSAGSICWFEQGLTDSIPGKLSALECLGIIPGSNSPHYDSGVHRRPRYHELLKEGSIKDGYAAEDGVALHYIDEKLHTVVSSRENARAYKLEKVGNNSSETEIRPKYLGA